MAWSCDFVEPRAHGLGFFVLVVVKLLGLGCRKHKNCMSQGNGPRHEGAEGIRIACSKMMGLGTRVLKATQSLRVAERCS
ncbi:unnamed protein product [Prunus armeniaca]